MKKLYTLIVGLFIASVSFAQDTILFEDFELTRFYDTLLINDGNPPPANTVDANWYSYDADGIPDASGSSRPDGWFAIQPFSTVDQYETVYGDVSNPDTNTCIGANSWNNNGEGAAGAQFNWLITPSVQLGAHDTLFFKAAPRQTPRYLDGYKVKISTTDNSDLSFGTTLFNAAECISLGSDTTFSTFGFSGGTPTPFVHGQDGTYIDFAGAVTNPAHRGQLRPFSIALDAYAGQKIFIAFLHDSHDDNLMELDDVMIRGDHSVGINENKLDLGLNLFPNPATDNVQVNYELSAETTVTITVYDLTGKLVNTISKGNQAQGRHFAFINTAEMAKGFYTVTVQTATGISTAKLIVK
ncbi:MAG: T9SS type A sorting domain-containing protein [Bacteroidia bacterium]|nr:T9SS type A sorting domain-containing protein [Bacteroidia bacterium]